MSQQGRIAVIGAGVVGAAVAYALARQGQRVTLIDRMAPGFGGASFGNAGHIAAELVQPLPSPALLFGFWRMLFGFGGALDLSCRHAFGMLPWVARFARAAFMREANTRSLAPLVRPASSFWARWLGEIGHASLLRLNGHYEVAFGAGAAARMKALREAMGRLAIDAWPMPAEALAPVQHAARAEHAAGLWFPDTAHVLDPLAVVRVLVGAATDRQARVKRLDVRALRTCGAGLEILSEEPPRAVDAAVICAGMGSTTLLAPFGLRAPLESARGYHVELPGAAPLLDAPLVYANAQTVVTPMAGRLRARRPALLCDRSSAHRAHPCAGHRRARGRPRRRSHAADPHCSFRSHALQFPSMNLPDSLGTPSCTHRLESSPRALPLSRSHS
jgi:D-hydroxyproline dehydrogenase